MMGSGLGLLDYDQDGDLDVYLVQGVLLGDGTPLIAPADGQPPGDRLFRNDLLVGQDGSRTLRFTDVTDEAGIVSLGYGMGVATGDYDNDGHVDLYLTRFGPNQMFRNRGDGTFADVSIETGTDDPAWGVPAAFFDYDRDGWLDLFVGNYLDYTLATHTPCYDRAGAPDYCMPGANQPHPDVLYRNRGDGTFENATTMAGLAGEYGPALGPVTTDADGDGWLDLFVANDQEQNQLWVNQRDGTFRNMALPWGAALGAGGNAKADMGVGAGDFDNDGDEDLFITELTGQGSTLYVSDGTGLFRERSAALGIRAPSLVVANAAGPVRLLINEAGHRAHWLGLRLMGGDPPRDVSSAWVTLIREDGSALRRRARAEGSYASANDPRVIFGLGASPDISRVSVTWPSGLTEEWDDLEAGRYTRLNEGGGRPR